VNWWLNVQNNELWLRLLHGIWDNETFLSTKVPSDSFYKSGQVNKIEEHFNAYHNWKLDNLIKSFIYFWLNAVSNKIEIENKIIISELIIVMITKAGNMVVTKNVINQNSDK